MEYIGWNLIMSVLTFYHVKLMQSTMLEEEWLLPFACTPKPLVITSTVEPLYNGHIWASGRCEEVAIVESFFLSAGTEKIGRCREVAIRQGLTVISISLRNKRYT